MELKEEWVDINGYEGLYQISNYGRVKSLPKPSKPQEVIVKSSLNNNGYLRVNLWKNRKYRTMLIHRLVAIHFVENKKGGNVVNHKDYNIKNNRATNLEWCTQKENCQYSSCNQPKTKNNAPLPSTGEKYVHKIKDRPGYYVGIQKPKKTTRYFKNFEDALSFRNSYYREDMV